MLDAGALSLIVRAGAGVNTIDVAGASKRGIYVSNCPGKNSVAVAELTFGADARARPPGARQRRRAARRDVEQEGILEGRGPDRPDARPARLRQHRPGGGEARARLRHAGARVEPPVRRDRPARAVADEPIRRCTVVDIAGRALWRAATWSACISRSTKETRGFVGAAILEHAEAGRVLHQHRSRRGDGLRGARGRGASEQGHPRRARRVRERADRRRPAAFADAHRGAAERLRHASHRRVDRSGAGSDCRAKRSASSAPTRRPARCRTSSTWPSKTPATHMLVVRHRDRPGVLAHVFEHLRAAHLNVQETENIIFEGAASRRRAHQSRRRAVARAARRRCRRQHRHSRSSTRRTLGS